MDNNNYKDLIVLIPSIEEKMKVNYIHQNQENLPDSYYGGTEALDQCFHFLKMLVNVSLIF